MSERDNGESPLGRARDRLYDPVPVDGIKAEPLQNFAPAKPEGWKHEEGPAPESRPPRFSGPALFLIFAVGFFVLAGIVAAVVLFLGGRSLSSDHLDINVEGPTTVSGGESVSLLITVTNENPSAIQDATLELAFPEGVYAAADGSEELTSVVEELGTIPAGESVRKTVRATFFGEENSKVSIPITVEYQTEKSNATFVSKRSYDLVIATAPVTLSVDTLSEISAGQPLKLTVTVRSNALSALENVAVRADYPFGFSPTRTSLVPVGDLFVLGTLRPGEEKQITIEGPLTGLEGEERVFHFSVGTLRATGSNDLGIPYSTKEAAVSITKAFLAVSLGIDRNTSDTVVIQSNEMTSALLSWQNTLSTPVTNARLTVAISGDAFDPGSVKASGGFYRSSDRTVVFDVSTNERLANLAPGETGSGSFLFGTKSGSAMASLRQPVITLSVSVAGTRVGADKVPETVTSTLTRTLKVATDLSLTARTMYSTGPFTNTGPWPPVAEQKTTYTVLLTAKNTVNSVADATVTATLPPYVRFTGQVTPVGAITFDEASRTMTWSVGEMAAATTKEGAFQVELLPSTTQKGTSPELTSDMVIAGFDRFVQQQVSQTVREINIQATSDPSYTIEKGTVK
ncbi:MAG TPA: hypothetical protein VEB18_00695 [Candidatus Paceibacterota bacterium]|nr:hypothetical protein [Candidatus Paceibacterota bacterium]